MSSLLNCSPHMRNACTTNESPPSYGPNVPYTKPDCAQPSAHPAEETNLGSADSNATKLGLSGSELLNSSEFQELVNNCVKSELMKSESSDSLDVWVGKMVTSTLKANGVDLSSTSFEKVLQSVAQETSKQLLGMVNQAGATISEVGSNSNETMLPAVAKEIFPPKGHMDIGSRTEGKLLDGYTTSIPDMNSFETKLPRRKVSAIREYPPFCGRNAPCPTEEERSRINSKNKKQGKEVIADFSREVSSKTKQLELARGNKVIGVSVQEMFPRTKKLVELGRPLKAPARNDSKNNSVRELASTAKEKNAVAQLNPMKSTIASKNIDMREKVRHTLVLFRTIVEDLSQQEKYIRRVDLEAAKIIKDSRKDVNTERQWIGAVPGVEVGDKFFYRAELMVVGLHRHSQGGIDYVKNGTKIVATSIIASGGYSDDMANPDVLIYSGQGGSVVGRKDEPPKDQKMERGNLALKNCISTKAQVRVTRGIENNTSRARARITFTYDGLYTVERFWTERGQHGKLVFMFELRRVPGQPRTTR